MLPNENDGRKWWILSAMGAVMGMLLLDETVVAVALPTIRVDLAMSQGPYHWVINAYLLTFASLTAFGGKLGDLLGHRTIFISGAAAFGVASLVCGFAGDGSVLIIARALQGVGAAMIFPASLAMIMMVFPPQERGTALGIWSAAGTVFLALGPLVGGFLVHVLSWRWIFWINPPVVAVIMAVILWKWREPAHTLAPVVIDFRGFAALASGLGMFVFGIMQGPDWGWLAPPVVATILGGLVLLAVFTFMERRIEAPLLDLNLLRNPTVASANLVIFNAQFNQMAIVVFGALYLQQVLHMTPLAAGLALLPAVGAAPLTGAPTGRLVDRFGARRLTFGALLLTIAALLWVSLAVDRKDYLVLVPAFIGWGAANCAMFIGPRKAVTNTTPNEKQGEASGVLITTQQLGGTLGVAVCGIAFMVTQSFRAAFLAPTALSAVSLVVAWFCLEADDKGKEQ